MTQWMKILSQAANILIFIDMHFHEHEAYISLENTSA